MATRRLGSEEIKDGKRITRYSDTTHFRVEGNRLAQYRCNPTPEDGLVKVERGATGFYVNERKVNNHVFSRSSRATGIEDPTTLYWKT